MPSKRGASTAAPAAGRRTAALEEVLAAPSAASTSRLVSKILSREQIAEVNHARALLSALAEGRDLIELGAYVHGTNPTLDRALAVRDRLDGLLRQDASSISSWDEARRMLTEVLAP